MTFKDVDWNEALQLSRLLSMSGQGNQIAIRGRLTSDGVYQLDGADLQESPDLKKAAAFAKKLTLDLIKAGIIESSDTDTPYVPFVVAQPMSQEELVSQVKSWLGVIDADDITIEAKSEGFWIEEVLNEHVADDDVEEYYDPDEVKAIRKAAKKFATLEQHMTIIVEAGGVARLIINLGQHPSGFWSGLATLRIDT